MFVNKILSKYIHVRSCFEGFITTIWWCNRNLIWTFGLAVNTFFSWLKVICMRADVGEVGVDQQPVRLASSFRCWFVKKYCWLVCVREKYCSGWKFTIVYDKPQPNEHAEFLWLRVLWEGGGVRWLGRRGVWRPTIRTEAMADVWT